MKRTGYCGLMREGDIGKNAVVMGWVQNKRDMGGVIFIDLRDREGVLQTVFDANALPHADFSAAEGLRAETVVAVSGRICKRQEETYNPRIATGAVELRAQRLTVLSEAEPLPFGLEGGGAREEVRLKYRFLDLRRPKLLENLRFRARAVKVITDYLNDAGFLQVETPMLAKSTPEGAREYLVPSRVHPGEFYALPQSPQIFKQLLMVGGIDRYYQVARCFRDEDLRSDRQPEFTQVDMELSFVEQEDILEFLESLFKHVFQELKEIAFPGPFPRLTWREAMDRYGSDKPDLRFGLPIVDLTEKLQSCGFSVFRQVIERGGFVRAINVKGGGDFSRGVIEELTQKALSYGAKGMAWIALKQDGEPYSILTKYFSISEFQGLLDAVGGEPGDFILFCADTFQTVCRTLGGLRLDLADLLKLRAPGDFKFLIVTEFPEFEYSEEEGRYLATHHPFTMPYPEDLPYLLSDPARVRAQAYDVVLNGVELGSGSIRIHQREVQQRMFEALGFSQEQITERFGFMVDAFRYGTPPHGGFAFGLDRLVMQMLEADSLRDVIAFPKTKDARCPMTGAPAAVDAAQLETLHLPAPQGPADNLKTPQKPAAPDVERVAELAKLRVAPEKRAQMAAQMRELVAFVDRLAELDTSGVEPMIHVVPVKNAFRTDDILPPMDRELILQNTPRRRDDCFFVPQAVE